MNRKSEWASAWPLPIVAMLGVSGSGMFAYSSGVFMERMTNEFGWGRAEFSTAFVLQMAAGLIILPATGWFIDRFGPRRVFLTAVAPFLLTFGLLGLASGSIFSWWGLCLMVALFQSAIGQTVWIAAVIARFTTSRGLAMAITLSGLGVGSLIWPVLSAVYIEKIGWRLAFPALAMSWGVIIVPLSLLVLKNSEQTPSLSRGSGSGANYGMALRSFTFIGLLTAGSLFACAYYGLVVHLVPILRSNGLSLTMAAAIGGVTGIFAIIGRLVTGYLLDRLPVRAIGAVAFLLPIVVVTLLLLGGDSLWLVIPAVALLGLAAGAEMDIVTFIAARHFGPAIFGSIYALFTAILAVCASFGPIIAGALFDHSGNYAPFLLFTIPLALVGALLIVSIPIVSAHDEGARHG